MKSILDRSFVYVPSANTDLKATFERVRREQRALTARFPNVSCSQCGQDFGPGDEGFSRCADHRSKVSPIKGRK